MKRQSFWITGELTAETVRKFAIVPAQRVDVFVFSPGGDVGAALALIHLMSRRPKKSITVTAVGEVCSAAALLVAGAPKGRRFSLATTLWGLHEPFLTGSHDDPATQQAANRSLNLTVELFYQALTDATTMSWDTWKQALQNQSMVWLKASQARAFHLVDELI